MRRGWQQRGLCVLPGGGFPANKVGLPASARKPNSDMHARLDTHCRHRRTPAAPMFTQHCQRRMPRPTARGTHPRKQAWRCRVGRQCPRATAGTAAVPANPPTSTTPPCRHLRRLQHCKHVPTPKPHRHHRQRGRVDDRALPPTRICARPTATRSASGNKWPIGQNGTRSSRRLSASNAEAQPEHAPWRCPGQGRPASSPRQACP
jgi:hypothetical protein